MQKVGSAQELEMLVYQALVSSSAPAPSEKASYAVSASWSAFRLGKSKRWNRELLLRLSHGDHRLTYQENFSSGAHLVVDDVDVGKATSGISASLLRASRIWRRWVVPISDGPSQLPLTVSTEVTVSSTKVLSFHVKVGERVLYAEGSPPPRTGWSA